jgi:hypothetical protein
MRTIAEWLTPVRATGMATYLVAASSCGVAWVRVRRDKGRSRLALILGILQTAIFLDIAFDWRWKLYDLLRSRAMANQWYNQRHWPQIGMLALLTALLLIGIGIARRRYPSAAGAVLATEGALLSIGCWSTEVISLHATDALLYHRAGPLMIVNFVWALACTMTVIGIWKASG